MATPVPLASKGTSKDPRGKALGETLAGLQSRELIVGFSGPLGSGVGDVIEVVDAYLRECGYDVVRIKLSGLISEYATLADPAETPAAVNQLKGADRYDRLQTLGNKLRSAKGLDFLAQLAIRQVSMDRVNRHPGESFDEIVPKRVAYLIDQLKHPSEVALLRKVYDENFILIGVLCGFQQRRRNLSRDKIEASEAERLMERDRREDENYGQKLEKTLQLSDFFVRNSRANTTELRKPLSRFLNLIHGSNATTPTQDEQGMYAAFAAALGSACLSRQVGASIIDSHGELIATGCNDVPRAGGGLYREDEDKATDHRCVHLEGGTCFNDRTKDAIATEIRQLLREQLTSGLAAQAVPATVIGGLVDSISRKIRGESRLKDLIEFSRAVHAEMDALVSVARVGTARTQAGVLYTTTYPCHNCARHIVASGIRSVYFIEPYEKSLAYELHWDAIDHDANEGMSAESWTLQASTDRKVRFLHFEGVAPRRFLDLFSAQGRKDPVSGKARAWSPRVAEKKSPEFLEGYIDLEARVVKHLQEIGVS